MVSLPSAADLRTLQLPNRHPRHLSLPTPLSPLFRHNLALLIRGMVIGFLLLAIDVILHVQR